MSIRLRAATSDPEIVKTTTPSQSRATTVEEMSIQHVQSEAVPGWQPDEAFTPPRVLFKHTAVRCDRVSQHILRDGFPEYAALQSNLGIRRSGCTVLP